MKCKHHGPASQGVWACPACLVELREENQQLRKDAERIDWIEKMAKARKIEIAKSIMGTGYEIGEWPSLRVTVGNGNLREVIDKAMR